MVQLLEFVTIKNNNKNFVQKQNIFWHSFNTPIGELFIEETDGFITKVSFNKMGISGNHFESELIKKTKIQIDEFLNKKRKDFDFPIKVFASEFQIKVLKQLSKIPYGQTKSYMDIAKMINIKGARAVGNACGKNPILLAIPCHRVINSNGKLGGFTGKSNKKLFLLENENIQIKK